MPFSKWSDELMLGIAELDRDHERLLDLLNELRDAVEIGDGRQVLSKVLEELRPLCGLSLCA